MKVQYNQMTKMTWTYIPTSVAKLLNIKKGDEIDFLKLDNVENPTEIIFSVKKKIKIN